MRRIYSGDVDIVYGAKGAGKSAIYSILLDRQNDLFAEARMIWLDTHLTNAAARGLYGAIGYREVGVELVKEL